MSSLTKADIAALIPRLYGRKIYEEAQAQAFWSKFEGNEGSGLPIIVKSEPTKEPGDTIRIGYTYQLTGAGRTGEQVLEGYEEALVTDYMDVSIALLRHATRHQMTADEQGIINLAEREKSALAQWLSRTLDQAMFTALDLSPTNVIYANDATSINTIDALDVFDTETISRAKVYADDLLIPPMTVLNGTPYYGMVIHPYQAYSLKEDTVWQNAQREAMPPGEGNPLFTGALGHWDGVVLFSHPWVPRALNANSPAVYYSDAMLFGAEAALHAYGRYPLYTVETFDYKESVGTGVSIVHGLAKVKYTTEATDKSVVIVRSASADPNA
jgi:N4-gp56 family major capsid protein